MATPQPQKAGNKVPQVTGAPKDAKVKRFSKRTKFVAGAAQLLVNVRQGKDGGYNVSSVLKVPNQKTETGEKSSHKEQAAAMEAYDKSIQKAKAKGWQERSSVTRQGFPEIPDAAKYLQGAPAAPAA